MIDPRIQKLAQNLVNYSCKVKKGERVLIECVGSTAISLIKELIKEVYKAGGEPYVAIIDTSVQRELLKKCSIKQLKFMAEYELMRIKGMNAFIGIRASDNVSELSDTSSKRMADYMKYFSEAVNKERVDNTKWVVLRYPNNAMAQLANSSLEAFEDFYFNVCNLDYSKMSKAMDSLVELMNKTDKVRIKGPDTDLTFSIKGILVQFGRQNIKWGNSLFSPLFLSDNAPSFDMLKIYVPFSRKVNFTYIHGELRSDYSHKWIAAHRIEFLPFDKFSIGFNESVVYGKRGIESAYLNPLIPYLIAEHTLGDRDNVCMGIDFKILPIRNVKIYGELFIDDLFSPFDLFENYWGNKLAFQTGLSLEDPFKINNSRFTAEYTRIDPFVYTHEDTVNIYENYTYGLGHFLRPNSDMINVEFIKRFSLFMQSKISFMHIRHGRGEINISHTEEDGELKNFLKGTLEITDKKEISFNFQPKRDVYINFVLRNMSVVNPENIQGKKFSWNEFTLNTSFNW